MSNLTNLQNPSSSQSSWASACGPKHPLNEDAYFANANMDGHAGIWAVADGIGGHAHGNRASARVVAACAAVTPAADLDTLVKKLRRELNQANIDLRSQVQGPHANDLMGSTLVALVVHANRFACLWAGDSRLYRLRNSSLQQISKDHSLLRELIAQGRLRPELAARHPAAHCITRAVGTGAQLMLDEVRGELAPDDTFLLCSDGLSNSIDATQLQTELTSFVSANHLLQIAQANRAQDDVTVGVVKFDRVDVLPTGPREYGPQAAGQMATDPEITAVNLAWLAGT